MRWYPRPMRRLWCAGLAIALVAGCRHERKDPPQPAASSTSLPAQVVVPETAAHDARDVRSAWLRPFLWRIETTPPSYLFGTMHMPSEHFRRLPRNVELAFSEATVLSTEVPLDGRGDAEYLARATLPPGTALNTLLPAPLFERARRTFVDAGQPFAPMNRYKPWFVGMRVSMLDHAREIANGTAMDKALYVRAVSSGKELDALETMAEQGAIFDGLDTAEQTVFLERSLDSRDLAKRENRDPLLDLVAAYLQGDDVAVHEELFRDYDPTNAVDVKVMKRLIDDRNIVMTAQVKKQLASGKTYFVAVGAAHLLGPRSVVALLQKSGIKVQRVD